MCWIVLVDVIWKMRTNRTHLNQTGINPHYTQHEKKSQFCNSLAVNSWWLIKIVAMETISVCIVIFQQGSLRLTSPVFYESGRCNYSTHKQQHQCKQDQAALQSGQLFPFLETQYNSINTNFLTMKCY